MQQNFKSSAGHFVINLYFQKVKFIYALLLFFIYYLLVPRELETLKLPEGWIGVNHYSGGIVYLHKKSRVVTWSRPYSIGEISLRVC